MFLVYTWIFLKKYNFVNFACFEFVLFVYNIFYQIDTWPGPNCTFQIFYCLNFQTSAEYFYVDVWSSPFTWGGGPLPKDGDFVVISKGQNILLDVDSPKLKIILIRGRTLWAA